MSFHKTVGRKKEAVSDMSKVSYDMTARPEMHMIETRDGLSNDRSAENIISSKICRG